MIRQIADKAEDLVGVASSTVAENSLRSAAERMRTNNRWLSQRNPYRKDTISALRKRDIQASELGEYIACSAPLHLTDGWNYLARAFDSTLRGDHSSAHHLAYYAELRAAMSLLATEGIGVFDRKHIAFDAEMQPTELERTPTHQATWELLNAWSHKTGSASKLLDTISLDTISLDPQSLSQWLKQVGVHAPAQDLVAREWLQAWSIDLEKFSDDRSQRNEMSYRPTRIHETKTQSVYPLRERSDSVFNSWDALQPTIVGVMVALDISLLRKAIELAIQKKLCNYSTFHKAWASLQSVMPPHLHEALKSPRPSATAIFREAKKANPRAASKKNNPGASSAPILARALLMLRLASASTGALLKAAEISRSDVEFWWSPLGTDLGLWDNPSNITHFTDLWADVQAAIETAEVNISSLGGASSIRDVASILTRDMSLTQFSRAPMWLLGLK